MPREPFKRDVIAHLAWDTLTVATSATTRLVFFQQTRSVGSQLTNMKVAGMFPFPEKFVCRSVRIVPHLATSVAGVPPTMADVRSIYRQAWVNLNVGSKDYIDGWPIEVFNAGNALSPETAAATAPTATQYVGSGDPSSVFTLAHPIQFNPNEPFRFEINWSAAPTPSAAIALKVVMGGTLVRAVQ